MSSRVLVLLLAASGTLLGVGAAHAAPESAAADTFYAHQDWARAAKAYEQSSDDGSTWTVVYDFNYLRRKK